VGFNYDTGNIYYYNDDIDPAEDIQEIADRVIHVHLKDTQGGKSQWQFCALGEGRVNFPNVIQTLESVGYDGPYSLEIEGWEGEDLNREQHQQRLVQSLDYLRKIGLLF
jgi:sugar phosphate isomerase/epimerase